MKLDVNINTKHKCEIIIEDNTIYPEIIGFEKNKFAEKDVSKLTVLYLNSIKNPSVKLYSFDKEVVVNFDGYFTIYYIVLPTKEWVYSYLDLENKKNYLNVYNIVYYTDGKNILKYIPKTGKHKSVTDLEEILQVNSSDTTISITSKEYVSICNLEKCYLNLCKLIFESRGFSQCWNKNTIDSELVYKRDLVWMAINVIKYLVECNQLNEAQRIIEMINGCNGVCGNNEYKVNNSGCGCS